MAPVTDDQIPTLFTISAYRAALKERHDHGRQQGTRTGWPSVDRLFTVMPGQLTIVTGWPGSGKSEWIDALLVNLLKEGWRHVIFSPENQPVADHAGNFIEKMTGKPFDEGLHERSNWEEKDDAISELEDKIVWMDSVLDAEQRNWMPENVLAGADMAIKLKRGSGAWEPDAPVTLTLDPWNELEHMRPREWSETEYISHALTLIRRWARASKAHVFLVAHPQKLRRDDQGKLPVPRPDSISGSQNWWNKADNCLTIWRDYEAAPGPSVVKVCVQKIRFKYVGRIGEAVLHYDRVTGRYSEPLASVPSASRY